MLTKSGLFQDLQFQNNSLADILDEAVIHKNVWLLLNCSKPNKKPYLITSLCSQ